MTKKQFLSLKKGDMVQCLEDIHFNNGSKLVVKKDEINTVHYIDTFDECIWFMEKGRHALITPIGVDYLYFKKVPSNSIKFIRSLAKERV